MVLFKLTGVWDLKESVNIWRIWLITVESLETVTLSNRHQLKQSWKFLSFNILGAFERMIGRSISTPLGFLPIDLQAALKESGNFKHIEYEGKVI